ncbi:hypothetical protein V6N11_083006 [Hibiscus sabdariffa]|uniref:Reverse transcriptase zinc-binding domain-containing protein n=1 Tax=Hibiscus sabdariffa TaxID=183260 RepID=A0ABR2QKK0_9ROSI
MFLGLVGHRKVMFNVERVRQHLLDDSSCGMCGAFMEDIDHILCFYTMAIPIWMEFLHPRKVVDFFGLNTKDLLMRNMVIFDSSIHCRELIVARIHQLKEKICSKGGAVRFQAPHLAHVN